MTAGLPGTGIGGLFYLLLAVLMPLREVALRLGGKSKGRRWAAISWQVGIAAAILVTMGLEMWGLDLAVQYGRRMGWLASDEAHSGRYRLGAMWAAGGSLTLVFVVVHTLRVVVRWRRGTASIGAAVLPHTGRAGLKELPQSGNSGSTGELEDLEEAAAESRI